MLISSSGLFIVIAALAFDALIGDPEWLWRRVGHPVTLIGALIDTLDRKFNRGDQTPEQRRSGYRRPARARARPRGRSR